MASASGSPDCGVNGSGGGGGAVPQWKRDLIQRRRQQNKVLTSNGASVKLCSAVTGAFAINNAGNVDAAATSSEPVERSHGSSGIAQEQHHNQQQQQQQCVAVGSCVLARNRTPDSISSCSEYSSSSCQHYQNQQQQELQSSVSLRGQTPSGATVARETHENNLGHAAADADGEGIDCGGGGIGAGALSPVVCNMRLEADASSICPSADDAPSCNPRNNQQVVAGVTGGAVIIERSEYENYENEDAMKNYGSNGVSNNKRSANNREQDSEQESRGRASRIIRRMDRETSGGVCLFAAEQTRKLRLDEDAPRSAIPSGNGRPLGDECESDSSEELQYGPGIVNRLKSKYLNLTLRETNKSRVSVQRFRRAASLEDLLDCEEETGEKTARKYAKRNSPGVAPKSDRYRNASRGNESMKRARSVETLMRYNAPPVQEEIIQVNRLVSLRQEPVNDHIVLIDRTTVKIESRLVDTDRPKAVNKPKRIKPLLAETERPPPDLVKTTMRIFEGSVKKFKPKGEVAVKVATFKTINDSYKAQTLKKVVPKPPIQPKPFVNGNSKGPASPKKISVPQIPMAELIEKPEVLEEYRNDCVVTEPIVQSVSSVVSKFQQIEKSHSPSPSPEPTYKFKFSPAPSPEPPVAKLKSSIESLAKSPPVTPIPSPRITSPALPSPGSPKRDLARQNSSPVQQSPSPSRELLRQASAPEVTAKDSSPSDDRDSREQLVVAEEPRRDNDEVGDRTEIVREERKTVVDEEQRASSIVDESTISGENETVDGSRTITKLALDNISKAGSTVQFNFGDKPSIGKSYLPGGGATVAGAQNGRKIEAAQTTNGVKESKSSSDKKSPSALTSDNGTGSISSMETSVDADARVNERFESEKIIDAKAAERTPSPGLAHQPEYTKPIGAISSLGLIKISPTTTAPSYPQSNESKTIRSQKSDVSPPQKQIGIIRPLVSTKTQIAQQNLSNRELEKNLINRVKSIEQPTKVVVSLKSAEEIQPVKKTAGSPGSGGGGGGGGGLWDTKPWNQANNTMVFNFSNRKDVPDYIENDGLIIRRKREKPKVSRQASPVTL